MALAAVAATVFFTSAQAQEEAQTNASDEAKVALGEEPGRSTGEIRF